MTEKIFSLVRRMTDFLKRYKPEDYEIFQTENDEILLKIYSDKNEPEVWILPEVYDVTFKDESEYFQLSLNQLIDVLMEKKNGV